MFTPVLRIKNAVLSLFLSLVLIAVAIQPAYASNGNGNAYAYGKSKHAAVSTSTMPSQPSEASASLTSTAVTNNQTTTQKPATVPGDNGDIKTHNLNTPVTDQRDEPKVCGFYLDAFNFDTLQSVDWTIVKHTHGDTVLNGSIVLTNGNGRTGDLSLPNGMYKVYWNFNGEHGSAKHKVFKVDCDETPTTPPVENQNPAVAGTSNTCVVAGQMSGSLTVSVTNKNTKAETYVVNVGNKYQTVTVQTGQTGTVQLTDLAAGTQTVKVYENGAQKAAITATVESCPPAVVGRGGGEVLGESTTKPAGAVLANTGEATLLGTLIASLLAAAGIAVTTRRASKQQQLSEISL